MSNFVPDKVFLRGVLLHYFLMKQSATETHRILVQVYGEHAFRERACHKWFARFKQGNFNLADHDRPGQPKKFEDKELTQLLDQNSCQTVGKLAETLRVNPSTVSKRLKTLGKGTATPRKLIKREKDSKKKEG